MALTYYAGTEGNFINLNVPNGETSAVKTYSIPIPAGTYNVTVPSTVNSVKIGNTELTTSGLINLSSAQNSSTVNISYVPIVWTSRGLPSGTTSARSMVFANGIFVGIGNGGNPVYTSTDGLTWTTRNAMVNGPTPAGSAGVVGFGKGIFVAAGGQGESSVKISTSTDGITWTTRTATAAGTSEALAITFNGVTFGIAERRSDSVPGVQTSRDGITWGSATTAMSSNVGLTSIGSDMNTGLMLVGGSLGALSSSANHGATWTSRTSGFGTSGINGIAHANGIWVAVGQANQIRTSPDGVTWTARTSGLDATTTFTNLKFLNGYFFAYGVDGSSIGLVTISTNGTTWTPGTLDSSAAPRASEYGNGVYVYTNSVANVRTSSYINPTNTTVQLEYKGIGA